MTPVPPPTPPAAPSPDVEARPRRWRTTVRRLAAPAALGLVGAIAGVVLFLTLRTEPKPLTRSDVQSAIATSIAKAAEAPPRSTTVYRAILPSLVLIRTTGDTQRADSEGLGSGVIVRDDGTILTANHVVDGARSISVTFADGTESNAQVLGAYPNDLAMLRVERPPELVVPAVLGGGPQVGDEAFAVGNPLGLTASLSSGVVSGLNRSIKPSRGGPGLTGLIQFDEAVNPGSSGGPLLNRDGQVIGIVTALANATSERAFTGIGFAVPLGSAGGLGTLPR